jgi:quercetin dioxygenase-like cupin family protein
MKNEDKDRSGLPTKRGEIHQEFEKSKIHTLTQVVDYVPDTVVTRTMIKQLTGAISISSFTSGQERLEKILPFDTYIQILDGVAEIIISGKVYLVKCGDGIIVPAHAHHRIKSNHQFKMISTIIKSGYEV